MDAFASPRKLDVPPPYRSSNLCPEGLYWLPDYLVGSHDHWSCRQKEIGTLSQKDQDAFVRRSGPFPESSCAVVWETLAVSGSFADC